jgi:hypothetical protein
VKSYPQQHQFEAIRYFQRQKQKTGLYTLAALAVVAAGYSAYTQYQTGQEIKRLNNYNAAVEEQNARTAQRDAAIKANQVRQQNARVLASQRAAFAANGIVGDTGSPLLVQAQQAGNLEMGALEVERQGSLTAAQNRQQAVLDRLSGSSAARAANRNASSTLLSSFSSAAGSFSGNGGTVKASAPSDNF